MVVPKHLTNVYKISKKPSAVKETEIYISRFNLIALGSRLGWLVPFFTESAHWADSVSGGEPGGPRRPHYGPCHLLPVQCATNILECSNISWQIYSFVKYLSNLRARNTFRHSFVEYLDFYDVNILIYSNILITLDKYIHSYNNSNIDIFDWGPKKM